MIFNLLVWSGLMLGLAADVVKSPSISSKHRKSPVKTIVKRQSQRFLVDEVSDDDSDFGKSRSIFADRDDYTDFNNLPVANRVNHNLKQVTFRPILPTYSTPKPVPRVNKEENEQFTVSPVTVPPVDPRAIRRTGFFFQHYPYDKMHRFYLLNPRLQFVYPREYENVEWAYPIERAPYFHQRQFYNLAALGYYGRK